jgi:hypothetical protein
MAKTQETLNRCTDLANAAFPEIGGACTARDAAVYLAHTENGESLRALAEATGTHPSTVMRQVRRVEARRDDPLVDSMISDMEGRAGQADDTPSPANDNRVPDTAPPPLPRAELEREARRFLRRLSEPGAFLLVTPETTKGGIFCAANDHRKPIAMLPVGIAVEFLREGWIKVFQRGIASIRYRVTEDGRSFLKRLLLEEAIKRQPAAGFADAATPFLAQHQLPGERSVINSATGRPQMLKVNLGEDPIGWLARRKGADGQPFLTADEVEAGERLRLDFEIAQMGPSVAQDWRKFLAPGDRLAGTPVSRGPGEGPMAARDRVAKALSDLGPGLADSALRVCCFLEGLEACERRMGWSARSGKVVLKIALQRLSQHYGLAAPQH